MQLYLEKFRPHAQTVTTLQQASSACQREHSAGRLVDDAEETIATINPFGRIRDLDGQLVHL